LGHDSVDPLLESVSHCVDFDFHAGERRGFEEICESATSAPTAAHQTYFQSPLRAWDALGKQ
jgi:hypothetical protein